MKQALLTGAEKAKLLGITTQALNQRVRNGQMDYVVIRVGKRYQRFYYPEDINLSIEMKPSN